MSINHCSGYDVRLTIRRLTNIKADVARKTRTAQVLNDDAGARVGHHRGVLVKFARFPRRAGERSRRATEWTQVRPSGR